MADTMTLIAALLVVAAVSTGFLAWCWLALMRDLPDAEDANDPRDSRITEADIRAVERDWQVIADDFRRAVASVRKENER